jgi:hypothetical protein
LYLVAHPVGFLCFLSGKSAFARWFRGYLLGYFPAGSSVLPNSQDLSGGKEGRKDVEPAPNKRDNLRKRQRNGHSASSRWSIEVISRMLTNMIRKLIRDALFFSQL